MDIHLSIHTYIIHTSEHTHIHPFSPENGEEHEVLHVGEGSNLVLVHVIVEDGVGQVGGHGQAVRDGQSGQQDVGGRHHVLPCQDDGVETVGQNAQHTHDGRQHSVYWAVGVLKPHEPRGGGVDRPHGGVVGRRWDVAVGTERRGTRQERWRRRSCRPIKSRVVRQREAVQQRGGEASSIHLGASTRK